MLVLDNAIQYYQCSNPLMDCQYAGILDNTDPPLQRETVTISEYFLICHSQYNVAHGTTAKTYNLEEAQVHDVTGVALKTEEDVCIYGKLKSFIVHIGAVPNTGQYVAYTISSDDFQWQSYNDLIIDSNSGEGLEMAGYAFISIYKKCNKKTYEDAIKKECRTLAQWLHKLFEFFSLSYCFHESMAIEEVSSMAIDPFCNSATHPHLYMMNAMNVQGLHEMYCNMLLLPFLLHDGVFHPDIRELMFKAGILMLGQYGLEVLTHLKMTSPVAMQCALDSIEDLVEQSIMLSLDNHDICIARWNMEANIVQAVIALFTQSLSHDMVLSMGGVDGVMLAKSDDTHAVHWMSCDKVE